MILLGNRTSGGFSKVVGRKQADSKRGSELFRNDLATGLLKAGGKRSLKRASDVHLLDLLMEK